MAGLSRHQERPDIGKIENRAPSIARMFLDRVAATPNAEAFRFPDHDGWTSVTWRQLGDRVELVAAGLIALGINPEERVALASATRYEWVVVDFAALCAGAATTTVYPTTNAEDVAFIVANSAAASSSPRTRRRSTSWWTTAPNCPMCRTWCSSTARATVTG